MLFSQRLLFIVDQPPGYSTDSFIFVPCSQEVHSIVGLLWWHKTNKVAWLKVYVLDFISEILLYEQIFLHILVKLNHFWWPILVIIFILIFLIAFGDLLFGLSAEFCDRYPSLCSVDIIRPLDSEKQFVIPPWPLLWKTEESPCRNGAWEAFGNEVSGLRGLLQVL